MTSLCTLFTCGDFRRPKLCLCLHCESAESINPVRQMGDSWLDCVLCFMYACVLSHSTGMEWQLSTQSTMHMLCTCWSWMRTTAWAGWSHAGLSLGSSLDISEFICRSLWISNLEFFYLFVISSVQYWSRAEALQRAWLHVCPTAYLKTLQWLGYRYWVKAVP